MDGYGVLAVTLGCINGKLLRIADHVVGEVNFKPEITGVDTFGAAVLVKLRIVFVYVCSRAEIFDERGVYEVGSGVHPRSYGERAAPYGSKLKINCAPQIGRRSSAPLLFKLYAENGDIFGFSLFELNAAI